MSAYPENRGSYAVYSRTSIRPAADVGVRSTFADLGQTIADLFRVGPLAHGTSFLAEISNGPE